MKNIGKPCAGKPHARFDEGGQGEPALYSTSLLMVSAAPKLGGGDFVDGLKQESVLRDKMKSVISLTRLLEIVSATLMLDPDLVRRPSKSRAPAAARAIICHLAIFELGYTGKEVGKFLYLGLAWLQSVAER